MYSIGLRSPFGILEILQEASMASLFVINQSLLPTKHTSYYQVASGVYIAVGSLGPEGGCDRGAFLMSRRWVGSLDIFL